MNSQQEVVYFKNIYDVCDYLNVSPPKCSDIWLDKVKQVWVAPNLTISPLKSDLFAVNLFIEGTGTIKIAHWEKQMEFPSVYLCPPRQTVSCELEESILIKYGVFFSENFIEEFPFLNKLISNYQYFQLDKSIPIKILPEEIDDLIILFEFFNKEYNKYSIKNRTVLASCLHIILLKVKELYDQYYDSQFVGKITHSDENIVVSFLKLLNKEKKNKDFKYEKTVNFYANSLKINANYLSRRLKTETGKTIKEHIHNLIIHDAKSLLRQTNLSIKEISYVLDFNEPSHFVNFFKKNVDITPNQFRKKALL
ncbi:helix-turn-helix domain-containing protein [Flavobacteriaceae bacterium W22]|uniref:helix-turn-helix domain-containing protein n=1 Tax=Chryseobacterium binzhouense TaxID=2593646 RepID=UPI0013686535|nr:helix-turn-helix transcriptional regulator [Chryseobacterium binzhouense]MXS70191.1 helix-turn-helix domain-containing protein [Flavobacteriaceae bacterium W22]